MRVILIEKHPDLTFNALSTATLKLNSLNTPDMQISGPMTISFKFNLVPMQGTLDSLEVAVKLTPEAIKKGLLLLGSYVEDSTLKVAVMNATAEKVQLTENFDAFHLTFTERVAVKTIDYPAAGPIAAIPVRKSTKKVKK